MAFITRQSIEGDLLISTENVGKGVGVGCWVDGSGNYIPDSLAVVINGVDYPVTSPAYFDFGLFNVTSPVPLVAGDQVYLRSLCSADQSQTVVTLTINLRILSGNATTCQNTTNISAVYDDRIRLFFNGNDEPIAGINLKLNGVNLQRDTFFEQAGYTGVITTNNGDFTTNNDQNSILISSALFAPVSNLKATVLSVETYQTVRLGYIEVILAQGVLKFIDYINGGEEESLSTYLAGDSIEVISNVTNYVIRKTTGGVSSDLYISPKNITFELPVSGGSISPNPTIAGTNSTWTLPTTPGSYNVGVLIGEGVKAFAVANVTACMLTADPKTIEFNKGTQNNAITPLTGTAPNNCTISSFKILSLPTCGTLKLESQNVTIGQVIQLGNAGNLKIDIPAACLEALVSFQYSALSSQPGCKESNPAVVKINLLDASATARTDNYRTKANVAVNFSVAGNDDICNLGNTYFELVSGSATHGVVSGFNSQNGQGLFTPESGYRGPAKFNYNIRCGSSLENSVVKSTAQVNIYIYGGTLVNDTFETSRNTPVSGIVATNDVINCDVAVRFEVIPSSIVSGSITSFIQSTGEFSWSPPVGYVGNDGQFQYNVFCGNEIIGTATVNISVVGVIVQPDSATTPQNTPVSGNVSDNDTYVCNGTIALQVKSGSAVNGSVTQFNSATGQYTFTPTSGFIGAASFIYQVLCNGQVVGEATVTITVSSECDICEELKKIRADQCAIMNQLADLLSKIKYL